MKCVAVLAISMALVGCSLGGTYHYAGSVVDKAGAPVPGAEVEFYAHTNSYSWLIPLSAPAGQIASVWTDQAGNFVFETTKRVHFLTTSKGGYLSLYFPWQSSDLKIVLAED